MKTHLLHACAFLALSVPAFAEIIGVEQFDYADGAIAGQSGGTFWDFGNIAAPVHDGEPSRWQNISGTPAVSSGRLVTDGNSAMRPHNGPLLGFGTGSDEEKGSVTDGRLQQVVYHRVTFTTGATVPDFLGLSTYDFGTERIFFGKRFGQSVFGIETTNGFGLQDSAVTIAANTTYTLVAKVDYVNNRLSLWINPTLGGTEPAANAVINSYTTNNFSTGVRLASGSGSAVTWDNLVSATTWAEVGGTVVTTTADEDDGLTSLNTPTDISLREAVKWSPSGTLITFAPALNGQTCTLSLGELFVVDRNLTIDASSLANGFTVDGNDASRIFSLVNKALTLKSLTLTKARAALGGGAIDQIGGQLFVQNCTLSENSAATGGAFSLSGATSRFENCTIVGNRATFANCTGGLVISDGTCTLVNCTISGNIGTGQGGGLFLGDLASVSLSNCIIAGNTDSAANDIFLRDFGGGITGTLTASGSNLIGSNTSVETTFPQGPLVGTQATPLDPKLSPLGYFGGPTQTMHPLIGSPAIDAGGTTDPGGTDARGFPRFVDGDTSSSGAQLDIGAVEAGPLRTVALSSDSGNSATLRGRISQSTEPGARIGFFTSNFPSQSITLNGTELSIPATANGLFIDASNLSGPVTISGNNASRVFNIAYGATLAMHSLKITAGRDVSFDGGSGILNNGSCIVISSTISGNSSLGFGGGGGINNSGIFAITRSTLSGNSADNPFGGVGGGIYNYGSLAIAYSTLSGNSADSGGGIYNGGTLAITHSTLSGNSADVGGGGIYNLIANFLQLSSSIVSGNAAPTGPDIDGPSNISAGNLVGGNPLLAALANNGGPTQTMALLPGSPARDAATGSTATTDQRGFPIVGPADIGAYEAQIGPIADVSLVESEAPPTRTFSVGQIGALTVTSSSNTALLPMANIVLSGSGASRSITVTPAAGQLGSALITLTEDLRGETQTFTLTVSRVTGTVVTNANDSGAGSLRAALSAAAGAAGLTTITFANGFTGPIALTSGEILLADSDPVVIDASSVSGGMVLSAGTNARHFQVPAGKTLTLRNLTLQQGNAPGDGGSIYSAGTLILERCTLSFNHSDFSGGAVESVGPLFRAVDCSFADNSAALEAGGIRCQGASAELLRCTISGNSASGSDAAGGFVFRPSSQGSAVTLTQCTIANNTSTSTNSTGGIATLGGSGTVNLIHCTVSGNVGGTAGGGIFDAGSTINLTNSIIAGNTASGGAPADIYLGAGTLTPKGANLIGSNQSVEAIFPAGPLVGTATALRDPMINGLNLFGGSTFTMPPFHNSPAIDQASVLDPALTTDQRGEPRPLGIRPDIGAVEGSVIVVTTPVDELDAPGSPGAGVSLREALRDVPTGGSIQFDRAVFNSTSTNTITLTKGPLNPQRNCFLNGTPNPGGIKVIHVPTITTQPQPQSVATGAAVTFSVAVTAVNGGVFQLWRKNDVFNGPSSATYTIPNAQETDEGVYDVVISETGSPGLLTQFNVDISAFSATSQPASLVVNGAPVTIQRSPSSAMIALGSSRTLSVVAVGPTTPALTYQWFKAGKAISGATKSSYSITNAQLTHAVAYTCVVKSGTTSVTSTTAEIGVVDARPKTINLKVGGSTTISVSAAGNGLQPFAWKRDATVLAPTAKSFPINPATIGDAGLYTCTVTGLAGSFTGGAPTTLNVSNAAPAIITPLALPTAFIGQAYFYTLPVSATAGARTTSFSMTGTLPSGMSFNTTTGVLSGRPTTTKTSGYALTFKAINAFASSPAAAATLNVNMVPTTAVGTFAGPMARSSLFNTNLGGRFDLTTSGNGLCSGGITLGARTKISFKNQLLLSAGTGDVILRANIPGITLADKTPLTAYVEVFAADQRAVLTLVHPTLGTTLITPAWRNPWLLSKTPSLNNPATAFAAKYSVRLDCGTAANTPNGFGYSSFTVSTAGTLTLAGKLPDGSAVSGGSFVSKDGEIALFNLLYATTNRGSHVGQLLIKTAPTASISLEGTTSWFKPTPLATSTDTVYKAGFGPLTVTAAGSPYVAPGKGAIVPGFTAVGAGSTNAKLNLTLGNLDVEAKEFTQLLRIANPSATGLTNTATIATPISNTTKMTTFTASSGQFVGSFTINGATTTLNRPAPFSGQLVTIGATTQGYGFFLLPTATAKISTSPKLSGRVVLGLP